MIVWNLNFFLQNIRKNSLIVNTILETQKQFDIILIQEPPWSEIHKIPSTTSCDGEPATTPTGSHLQELPHAVTIFQELLLISTFAFHLFISFFAKTFLTIVT